MKYHNKNEFTPWHFQYDYIQYSVFFTGGPARKVLKMAKSLPKKWKQRCLTKSVKFQLSLSLFGRDFAMFNF